MSKSIVTLLVFLLIGLIVLGTGCSKYNGFVSMDEQVAKSWANVQTQYQRRTDLIGNLVQTVQGAADFEKSVLTDVTEARAKATSINLTADDLTPEKMAQFQQAQSQLNSSLSKLLLVAENYPQLKATDAFRDLQAQLEGTENRVAVARQDFNEVVTRYNTEVRTFPGNIFAGMFGFQRKAQFEAEPGSEDAPKVQFDFK
jgi:LemA protein